jgi:hypothetical protein
VNACNKALSAYTPTRAPTPAIAELALPLQVYIIETVERNARAKLVRQASMVSALVIGLFVCQWPMAFSAANAVPTIAATADATGPRAPSPVVIERLTFAPGLSL